MAVPPQQLEAVAAIVSRFAGRSPTTSASTGYNLWFVATGSDADQVEQLLRSIEAAHRPARAAPAHAAPVPHRHRV